MVTPRAKALASLALFGALSGRDREFIATNLDEVSFEPGAVLMSQGDTNHTFFVPIEGHAEVTVSGELRRMMGPGDFFGEISMEQRVPATATIVAKTPVRAYLMSHAQFRAIGGAPGVLARLQAAIGDRLAADRVASGGAGGR